MRAMTFPILGGLLLLAAILAGTAGYKTLALGILLMFFIVIFISVLGFRRATTRILKEMDAREKARELEEKKASRSKKE
jgi:hypothetical protein